MVNYGILSCLTLQERYDDYISRNIFIEFGKKGGKVKLDAVQDGLLKGVQPNLVFHPCFNVVALMAEVKILDRVLQVLMTKLQGTDTQKLNCLKLITHPRLSLLRCHLLY